MGLVQYYREGMERGRGRGGRRKRGEGEVGRGKTDRGHARPGIICN